MSLRSVTKPLQHHLYIKLILLGLLSQIVSLFRNYPTDHPCGRVLSVTSGLNVLINCDSAVYMKDAQDPSRLFDGTSVYQDRPIPTLLVASLGKLWQLLNLPDFSREIVGNSGSITTYYFSYYLLFTAFSTLIFASACFLGIKALSKISIKFNTSNGIFIISSVMLVLFISMNEITKTFYWTPGSQMFNLLLPIYIFYLIQFSQEKVSTQFFVVHSILFMLLIFSYAFFILLYIPLISLKWGTFKLRILSTLPILLAYLAYPSLLKLFGGTYFSFGFGYRRLYLWVIDSYFDGNLLENLAQYLLYYIQTFPIIPSLLLLISITFLGFHSFTSQVSKKIIFLEIFILLIYILMQAFYGYYSRRLTYPIYIFMYLIVLRAAIVNKEKHQNFGHLLLSLVTALIIVASWIFSLGPLI
jgi:hypothetical protein